MRSTVPGFTTTSHLSSDFARDPDQLTQLEIAAGEFGDLDLVDLCRLARGGDQAALARIEEILGENAARAE